MKRLFVVVLSLALLLSCVACRFHISDMENYRPVKSIRKTGETNDE